ncbi:RNA polymerase sigma factor [Patescibacteria group bacterium]|nr:RNA polymerase sigma factor [Patescibacteria group bacterium]
MDRRQFEAFYHTHVDHVFRFVLFRVAQDRERAKDLTQEIFLKAFQAFDRYEPERGARAWIYTIARNHVYNAYAAHKTTAPLEEAEFHPSVRMDHLDRLQIREDERKLISALDRLPTEEAELIRQKYLEGWSFEELAKPLGKTAGALRVQAMRSLKRLRNLLTPS